MFVAMTAEVTPFPGLNAEPAQIDRAASGLVTYVVYCWEGERHRGAGGDQARSRDRRLHA
jgi:hypothetical protein